MSQIIKPLNTFNNKYKGIVKLLEKSLTRNSIIGILLYFLIMISTGCMPSIKTTVFKLYPSRPDDYPIKIFRENTPQCQYEEIGTVSFRYRNQFDKMEQVIETFKQKARKMGGNAIIYLKESGKIEGSMIDIHGRGNVSIESFVLSGIVIRFIDPACND